jgi:hypothetical protein
MQENNHNLPHLHSSSTPELGLSTPEVGGRLPLPFSYGVYHLLRFQLSLIRPHFRSFLSDVALFLTVKHISFLSTDLAGFSNPLFCGSPSVFTPGLLLPFLFVSANSSP